MLNRSVLPRLLALIMLLLTAGVVAAQTMPTLPAPPGASPAPNAPTAARVRIAHLAPFAGSDSATITVHIDGAAVGGALAYGDHTDYQTCLLYTS